MNRGSGTGLAHIELHAAIVIILRSHIKCELIRLPVTGQIHSINMEAAAAAVSMIDLFIFILPKYLFAR